MIPVNALSDICRTLVKILDDTPDAVAYYFCDYVDEILKDSDAILSQK